MESEWTPPTNLIALLNERGIRHHDRVEFVIAYYAAAHGGNSPSCAVIARIIGLALKRVMARQNVYTCVLKLAAQQRVIMSGGSFWLKESVYRHPLLDQYRQSRLT